MIFMKNRKFVFLITFVFLFVFVVAAFALNTYTINLSRFYTLGLGYSSLSNKNIALSPNIPQGLKCDLTASDLRYGSFKLVNKKIYIAIGYKGDDPVFFVGKPGSKAISNADQVTLGPKNYGMGWPNFPHCTTILNVKLSNDNCNYAYPIVFWMWFKSTNSQKITSIRYWSASFMSGEIEIDGKKHFIYLYNMNNGSYGDIANDLISVDTKVLFKLDRIFVGQNHFVIDGKSYRIDSISPAGTQMIISEIGTSSKKLPFFYEIGKEFPSFEMEFSSGKKTDLRAFSKNVTLIYFFSPPVKFNEYGSNTKINNDMAYAVSNLYKKYAPLGLKVISIPISQAGTGTIVDHWNDFDIMKLLKFNGLSFPILTVNSAHKIVNSVDYPWMFSMMGKVIILGKGNTILNMPIPVRNVRGVPDYLTFNSKQIMNFVDSLMKKQN